MCICKHNAQQLGRFRCLLANYLNYQKKIKVLSVYPERTYANINRLVTLFGANYAKKTRKRTREVHLRHKSGESARAKRSWTSEVRILIDGSSQNY